MTDTAASLIPQIFRIEVVRDAVFLNTEAIGILQVGCGAPKSVFECLLNMRAPVTGIGQRASVQFRTINGQTATQTAYQCLYLKKISR